MAGIEIDPKDIEGASAPVAQDQSQPTPSGGVFVDESMLAPVNKQVAEAPSGFKQGLTDPLYGISQILAKGMERLPEGMKLGNVPVAAAARAFNERVVPQREEQYQLARTAAGESGMDWSRLGGGAVSSLVPGLGVNKVSQAIAGGYPLVQSAITGGLTSGLLTPVNEAGNFLGEKIQQIGTGAVLGPAIDRTLGAVVSPAITASAQKMRDLGVNLTPGQAFGGITQTMENLLATLPLVGSTARNAQESSIDQFNRGLVNSTLSKIDDALPKAVQTGRDALKYMEDKVDQAYESVLPKVSLGPTLDLYKGIGDTIKNARFSNNEKAVALQKFIDDEIYSKLSSGPMKGRDFKNLDQTISGEINDYKGGVGDDKKMYQAMLDLKETLRGQLRALNPKDAPALDKANAAFADQVRIQRAASALNTDNGVFTPAQFEAAVKAGDITGRKSAFALGEAKMQDQAQAALNTIGRKGPSAVTGASGMAEGALEAGLGAGVFTGAINPLLPIAGGVAALGGYSPVGMAAFNKLMLSARPQGAAAVRGALPSAMSAPATGGLLRDSEGRYVIPINGVGQRQ